MDLYNHKRQLERTIERINTSKEISEENKKIILDFKNYLLSEGIGQARVNRYLMDTLKFNSMLGKTLSDANKEDIRRVMAELNRGKLSESTKRGFKILLRKLYRFIRGIEEKNEYPEEVKWLSLHVSNNHKKLPEELLTEEEIKGIIQKCGCLRDKALIATLAESGCRVSEVGTMKIKHVSFEEYGARLTVQGKTGMRKILVINCTPYLQNWVNQHPFNNNPESYLWVQTNGEPLCYARIEHILKNAAMQAGIKKSVYCHLLRHSRATYMARIMTDASMKQYFGWTQGSNMSGIYIHMSGKDTDEAVLRANGMEVKKETSKSIMEPKKCLRCHVINEVTNRFCKLCGLPLEKEEAEKILKADTERMQADEIMNKLIKDPEILELIKGKLKEIS